jgi:hypothetical protein
MPFVLLQQRGEGSSPIFSETAQVIIMQMPSSGKRGTDLHCSLTTLYHLDFSSIICPICLVNGITNGVVQPTSEHIPTASQSFFADRASFRVPEHFPAPSLRKPPRLASSFRSFWQKRAKQLTWLVKPTKCLKESNPTMGIISGPLKLTS